jgi:hypothetical protein
VQWIGVVIAGTADIMDIATTKAADVTVVGTVTGAETMAEGTKVDNTALADTEVAPTEADTAGK